MARNASNEDEKESCIDGVRNQWHSCLAFMYDPVAHTVMGRSGKSWAKILIFYLFYYGFLAALFAISISIVRGTLDEYTPTYQTRLQTPGVGVQPKIPSDVEQSSDIIYTIPAPDKATDYTVDTPYAKLVNQITTFLEPYAAENQTNTDIFRNCSSDEPMQTNQDFAQREGFRSCVFDKRKLGPCGTAPYGYDEGKPCLYIKLNRIIKWTPIGYTDLSAATATESTAPPLSTVLSTYGLPYLPYLMYVVCYGYDDGKSEESKLSKQYLDGNNMTNNHYFPTNMGLPFSYYPYYGKQRQPGYLNPIVAVQLTNVTRNQKIDVGCKVYALNIQDNRDMGEGFFRFDLGVNTE